MSDLVAQRKEIKRLEREWDDKRAERGEGERQAAADQKQKELDRFEKTAQGLEASVQPNKSQVKKRKADEIDNDRVGDPTVAHSVPYVQQC